MRQNILNSFLHVDVLIVNSVCPIYLLRLLEEVAVVLYDNYIHTPLLLFL